MPYFNPQGPHGPRLDCSPYRCDDCQFQSTRPSRASTTMCGMMIAIEVISIHKALTGLDKTLVIAASVLKISIHKALTGLDVMVAVHFNGVPNFNPQGPHGPRRERPNLHGCSTGKFQSTRPSRASTAEAILPLSEFYSFQSTRPSRASTFTHSEIKALSGDISIHKALTGLDVITFQCPHNLTIISIHKALTGLDREVCGGHQ